MSVRRHKINDILFSWDESKYALNLKTHGVTFEEAAEVFFDDLSSIRADPDHSFAEDRMIIIGHFKRNRLLFVSFTDNETIRLSSARTATRREIKAYEKGY